MKTCFKLVLPVPHVIHGPLEDEVGVVLYELRVHQITDKLQISVDGWSR